MNMVKATPQNLEIMISQNTDNVAKIYPLPINVKCLGKAVEKSS